MEKESSEDAVQALRNLVLMIASLTTCGYIDIKPNVAAIGSPFNIPGFSVPQPQGKGMSLFDSASTYCLTISSRTTEYLSLYIFRRQCEEFIGFPSASDSLS